MIYLDNSASTKPYKEVIDVLVQTMEENYANADAIHDFSRIFYFQKNIMGKTVNCISVCIISFHCLKKRVYNFFTWFCTS